MFNALQPIRDAVPPAILQSLGHDAQAIAVANLRAAAASRALLSAFGAAGLPLLFLKGLTLGGLAYRNAAVKAAVDVDVLIDPTDLPGAAGLLRNQGFEAVTPRGLPSDKSLRAWHRTNKESVWAKSAPHLQVDLHTHTADNSRLIPGIDVHSPRQLVPIGGGIRLPTLATEELFAYLAVHGASSAWFRLKWISDFAGLLNGQSTNEIERLYECSQHLGAGRAADQGLLLADALFGVLEPLPELRDRLIRDSNSRRLFEAALRLLTRAPREPTEARWGTFTIHWTQLLLRPEIAYKISEAARQARGVVARRI